MKKKQLIIDIFEYENYAELNTEDQKLLKKAKEITDNSYAPYSNFHVGAAVLLENGEIITGANQENAAYPSGLCAERVAIFWANSQYPGVAVKSIAVIARKEQKFVEKPVAPCGACRQVLLETEKRYNQPIKIILAGENRVDIIENAQSLLPVNFDKEALK
ncbi:MAG: cytidine deaminase [Bacteroidales bacterium]|nr:cytidine deaminase [Bacteroidales bacterium]